MSVPAARLLRFELRELLLVAMGAVPGALMRWQCAVRLGPLLGGSAGADLLVNVLGCFLLGILAGPIPRRTGLWLLGGIGFCGSLTTFSGSILAVVELQQRQQRPLLALLLLLASVLLGLMAAASGLALSRRLFARYRG